MAFKNKNQLLFNIVELLEKGNLSGYYDKWKITEITNEYRINFYTDKNVIAILSNLCRKLDNDINLDNYKNEIEYLLSKIDNIKIYDIFVGEYIIGKLWISNDEQHKYVANEIGLSEVKNKFPVFNVLTESTKGFVFPIPFFKNRLENNARFGIYDDIKSQTDNYRIVLVKSTAQCNEKSN